MNTYCTFAEVPLKAYTRHIRIMYGARDCRFLGMEGNRILIEYLGRIRRPAVRKDDRGEYIRLLVSGCRLVNVRPSQFHTSREYTIQMNNDWARRGMMSSESYRELREQGLVTAPFYQPPSDVPSRPFSSVQGECEARGEDLLAWFENPVDV